MVSSSRRGIDSCGQLGIACRPSDRISIAQNTRLVIPGKNHPYGADSLPRDSNDFLS